MSGTGIDETDLVDMDNLEPLDHRIRVLELQIAIAKVRSENRAFEEMARLRKLREMGYDADSMALDNDQFPAFTASDFSG